MKLATVKLGSNEVAGIVHDNGVILIKTINEVEQRNWSESCFGLIESGQIEELEKWYRESGVDRVNELVALPFDDVAYAPPYRNPRKIWGIGMNYVSMRSELGGVAGGDPIFFMKPDTSIVGAGDIIRVPSQSKKTTAEAELAILIGKKCKNILEEEAQDVIAGFTAALDMTAADIHAKNPRFMQRAKSFDTFFSFGPVIVTKDEVPDVTNLQVATLLNGEIQHENKVENMIYNPAYIVSFLSQVTTLLPGDVIITGTPGATVIREGDVVECRIDGFNTLANFVVEQEL
ncbi:fumarylacetoacetate hydrolase family protein [Halalkalibacter kiskunsagensis]|uniref:Fumarylacetoacetate hydrolase family protein n=1 Tax=Halalkalibacter kiskunsagensis TaxID=1548599 RepID=A0ABV6KH16_9BACI